MRAHVVLPWPTQDAGFKQRQPVITLCTMNPSTTMQEERLTFCRAGGEGGGRRSMYIYDKDDVLFGCIKRDVTRPRYVLTSSHYYQVRVAAGVDVGLIISGLLSIDAMETM